MNVVEFAKDITKTHAKHLDLGRFDLTFGSFDGGMFEGILIVRTTNQERGVHLYLCDDDPRDTQWMIDCTDLVTGEVDPKPFTIEGFEKALKWLVADAWEVNNDHSISIVNNYKIALQLAAEMGDSSLVPLSFIGAGDRDVIARFKPETGSFIVGDNLSYSGGYKPLYEV